MNYNPERMFVAGVAFFRASELCEIEAVEGLQPDPILPNVNSNTRSLLYATAANLMTPCCVNAAFSSEVLLKCLHVLATNNKPGGHNLKELYDKLPLQHRDGIKKTHRKRLEEQDIPQQAGEPGSDLYDLETLLKDEG